MIKAIKESYGSLLTWRTLSILMLCAVVAAVAGPFGTYEARSFPSRLAYWFLIGGFSLLVGHGCHEIARNLIPERRPILTDLFTVGLMTAVFSPPLWLFSHKILIRTTGPSPGLLELSYYVAIVSAGICVARRILPGFEPVGYFNIPAPEPVAPPRLMRRLSPAFQGPVLRLAVRDHFVDVVSAAGVETIRLRFADAIDEMDTVAGHCTHRSHWVVSDAITGSERQKDKIFLRLSNGDLVPVSRKYRPELEAAGLL